MESNIVIFQILTLNENMFMCLDESDKLAIGMFIPQLKEEPKQ